MLETNNKYINFIPVITGDGYIYMVLESELEKEVEKLPDSLPKFYVNALKRQVNDLKKRVEYLSQEKERIKKYIENNFSEFAYKNKHGILNNLYTYLGEEDDSIQE